MVNTDFNSFLDNATLILESTCQEDGTFTEILDWPTCREAMDCETSPIPNTAELYLLPTETTDIKEFKNALYSCQDGATLKNNNDNFADGFDIINGQFRDGLTLRKGYPL